MGPSITAAAAALLLAAATLLAASGQASTGYQPPLGSVPATSRDAVLAPTSPSPTPARAYGWPTSSAPHVVRAFERPENRWSPGHRGVDLALEPGAPVLAPADGMVAFAGMVAGRPVLSVLHADGIRTTYEPVTTAVEVGARVRAGAVLGWLAPTGRHCEPVSCLHWGARRSRNDYLDPLGLVRSGGTIRLFPDG